MNCYDSFICGASYRAFGYALTKENCLIAERGELCDTHFYAPLCCYSYTPYSPRTPLGRELDNTFRSLGLFTETSQNINGFESAFCTFLKNKSLDLRLKSRILSMTAPNGENGLWTIRLYTNSGIEQIQAKHLYDTRTAPYAARTLTVLYTASDILGTEPLQKIFPGSSTESAFYPGRYALYIPAENGRDLNDLRLSIYTRWKSADIDAKILAFAPTAGIGGENGIHNPIRAFETGIDEAKAVQKKEGTTV